jgi:hypothetical protein
MKKPGGRKGFRDWIDAEADPDWTLMHLTHVTKGLLANDIIEDGQIGSQDDQLDPIYCFYGKPAYRVSGDGVIKTASACPFCFVFRPDIIKESERIYAFDSGAFEKRMYKHILLDEMNVDDFSLENDVTRPNKLIKKTFGTKSAYFEGDTSNVDLDRAKEWHFLPRAYLQLIKSPGRNEPDDRVCSIEVLFKKPIVLQGNLLAVVVPHTLWDTNERTPWLSSLASNAVKIQPYILYPVNIRSTIIRLCRSRCGRSIKFGARFEKANKLCLRFMPSIPQRGGGIHASSFYSPRSIR